MTRKAGAAVVAARNRKQGEAARRLALVTTAFTALRRAEGQLEEVSLFLVNHRAAVSNEEIRTAIRFMDAGSATLAELTAFLSNLKREG